MNPFEIQKLCLLAENLLHSGNLPASENLLRTILKKNENNYRANELLGYCYIQKNNLDEGLRYLLFAAKNSKASSQLFYEIGSTYLSIGNFIQAEFFLDKAQKISPNCFEILHDLAAAQAHLGKLDKAVNNFELASQINSSSHELYFNIGKIHHDLNNLSKAVEFYSASLAIHPTFLNSLINKGLALQELKNYRDALVVLSEAYKIKGDDLYLPGLIAHLKMLICDWNGIDSLFQTINLGLDNGKRVVEPFGFQGISSSESNLLNCAKIYGNDIFPSQPRFLFNKNENSKIRIGYLSGEFRDHATSHLICGILELHSRDDFQIFGFDNGYDDKSFYRKRIESAFDFFFDISNLSDLSAANLIFSHRIDILINLNGYFGKGRQGIFALKPAPIQVNFLGFPGSLGVNYIDYVIADKHVLPLSSTQYYSEKVIYLPSSYQCNDSKKEISSMVFSKVDFGLPENSFIFCCFNNNYKISKATFTLWLRILKSVDDSVLWLIEDNELSKQNLRSFAYGFGVSPKRIIFSKRLKLPEHLARHKLADLFLDTLPYNAHTTASDALWSGLPLLTQVGSTFPGRVGSSLLHAVGLPDLITYSDNEFFDRALHLSKNKNQLLLIKEQLQQNILLYPLFNASEYVRNLEKAYKIIYQRFLKSEPIDHLYL